MTVIIGEHCSITIALISNKLSYNRHWSLETQRTNSGSIVLVHSSGMFWKITLLMGETTNKTTTVVLMVIVTC